MDGFVEKRLARGKTQAYFVSPFVMVCATLGLHNKSYIVTGDIMILGQNPVLKYSFFL